MGREMLIVARINPSDHSRARNEGQTLSLALFIPARWSSLKKRVGMRAPWHGAVVLRRDYLFFKRCLSAMSFLGIYKY